MNTVYIPGIPLNPLNWGYDDLMWVRTLSEKYLINQNDDNRVLKDIKRVENIDEHQDNFNRCKGFILGQCKRKYKSECVHR